MEVDDTYINKRWCNDQQDGLIEMMEFGVQKHRENNLVVPEYNVMPSERSFVRTYMKEHHPEITYLIG